MATFGRTLRTTVKHPGLAMAFAIDRALAGPSSAFWSVAARFQKKGNPPPIRGLGTNSHGVVDSFWGVHTVGGSRLASIKTACQDRRYLKWRFSHYPLFKELMELWGEHDGQIVLDYGCGPGNDLVGFLVYSRARKIIGIDISEKALRFASERLALHRVEPERVELVRISDMATSVPLDDNSVDYIYSEGVLHHTTDPVGWLREFRRVLKPGCQACIMVYNRDSVWFHLYTAYEQIILQGKFRGMSIEEAFARTTDTEECPISRCYKAGEFISMCKDAGLEAEYVGGYLSDSELNVLKEYREQASRDARLADEHRDFLSKLTFDERRFPKYEGKHAGVGGVYKLSKGSQ